MEHRYTTSDVTRFFLKSRAPNLMFQMYIPLDTNLEVDFQAMTTVLEWCAENIPSDQYHSVDGFLVTIYDQTYATSFKLRWC